MVGHQEDELALIAVNNGPKRSSQIALNLSSIPATKHY